MTDSTLIENFQKYFSVEIAQSQEQKEQAYKIRYRVYCEEFEYEPAERFPDKMEYDEYDDHSLHCLVIHKKSKLPAGCVRLVRTTGKNHLNALPIERFCADALDRKSLAQLEINRETLCEVSRLAVDGLFRRRPGEKMSRFGYIESLDISHQEKRSFSLIAVACFIGTYAIAELNGQRDGLAMMEPYLPRLLRKSGVAFQKIGEEINYHGFRAPYYTNIQSVLKNMHPDLKEFYLWIRREIELSCLEPAQA